MFAKMKLKTKLLIYVLTTFFVIFAVFTGFVIWNSYKMSEEEAMKLLTSVAHESGAAIETNINGYAEITKTLANVFSSYEDLNPERRRTLFNYFLADTLKSHDDIVSIWTCWEPNALDGRDALNVNGMMPQGVLCRYGRVVQVTT